MAGVRTNQLVGYGLVVGLDGTGDQTTQAPFTVQSIANMLAKFGVTDPAERGRPMQLKNVAAVTVTAELPPFAKTGQTIDVTVASIGNATSLRGGALLMTPLRGADGEVYAMAQGSVMVSGFGVDGKDGSRVSVNVPSGGRIPNGATVEREVPNNFASEPFVILNLNTPDFTTAARLTDALNKTARRGQRAGARRGVGQGAGAGRSGRRASPSSARCRRSRSSRARRRRASSSIRAPARS